MKQATFKKLNFKKPSKKKTEDEASRSSEE